MKKAMVMVVAIAMLVAAGTAFAGQAQSNTGCGLGTLAFKNNADNSILLQVVQSFLNGIFLNQSFGITFGTSECAQPKNVANNEKATEFMVANMDNLAREIAQGRGETLDAFAELMGVPTEKRPEFYASLQAGFTRIYTSPDVKMASVMDNISTIK